MPRLLNIYNRTPWWETLDPPEQKASARQRHGLHKWSWDDIIAGLDTQDAHLLYEIIRRSQKRREQWEKCGTLELFAPKTEGDK